MIYNPALIPSQEVPYVYDVLIPFQHKTRGWYGWLTVTEDGQIVQLDTLPEAVDMR